MGTPSCRPTVQGRDRRQTPETNPLRPFGGEEGRGHRVLFRYQLALKRGWNSQISDFTFSRQHGSRCSAARRRLSSPPPGEEVRYYQRSLRRMNDMKYLRHLLLVATIVSLIHSGLSVRLSVGREIPRPRANADAFEPLGRDRHRGDDAATDGGHSEHFRELNAAQAAGEQFVLHFVPKLCGSCEWSVRRSKFQVVTTAAQQHFLV